MVVASSGQNCNFYVIFNTFHFFFQIFLASYYFNLSKAKKNYSIEDAIKTVISEVISLLFFSCHHICTDNEQRVYFSNFKWKTISL